MTDNPAQAGDPRGVPPVRGHCYLLERWRDGSGGSGDFLGLEHMPSKASCLEDGIYDNFAALSLDSGATSDEGGTAAPSESVQKRQSSGQSRIGAVVVWVFEGGWKIVAVCAAFLAVVICACSFAAMRVLRKEPLQASFIAKMPVVLGMKVPMPFRAARASDMWRRRMRRKGKKTGAVPSSSAACAGPWAAPPVAKPKRSSKPKPRPMPEKGDLDMMPHFHENPVEREDSEHYDIEAELRAAGLAPINEESTASDLLDDPASVCTSTTRSVSARSAELIAEGPRRPRRTTTSSSSASGVLDHTITDCPKAASPAVDDPFCTERSLPSLPVSSRAGGLRPMSLDSLPKLAAPPVSRTPVGTPGTDKEIVLTAEDVAFSVPKTPEPPRTSITPGVSSVVNEDDSDSGDDLLPSRRNQPRVLGKTFGAHENGSGRSREALLAPQTPCTKEPMPSSASPVDSLLIAPSKRRNKWDAMEDDLCDALEDDAQFLSLKTSSSCD